MKRTQQEGTLAQRNPREVIRESAWDEYSRGLRLLWSELVRFNVSLFILRYLMNFPKDIIGPGQGIFLPHIGSSLYDNCLLVLTKLLTDKGPNAYTLNRFKNLVLNKYLKEDYRRELRDSIRALGCAQSSGSPQFLL